MDNSDQSIDANFESQIRKVLLSFIEQLSPCTQKDISKALSQNANFARYVNQTYHGGIAQFVQLWLSNLEHLGLIQLENDDILLTAQGKEIAGNFSAPTVKVQQASRHGSVMFSQGEAQPLPSPSETSEPHPSISAPNPAPSAPLPPWLQAKKKQPLHQPASQDEGRGQANVAEDARYLPESRSEWLAENIPRQMTVRVPKEIEIRISKDQIDLAVKNMRGRGDPQLKQIPIAAVMSLGLSAPKDGFNIHRHSPEAQWIGQAVDPQNLAHWRFTLEPTHRGLNVLELNLSYKEVDASGLIAESMLPDVAINIQVKTNLKRSFARASVWTLTLLAGAALGAYGNQMLQLLTRLLP